MIPRDRHRSAIVARLKQFPVVGLIGARQVGKTTLAREVATSWGEPTSHWDLEDPRVLSRLENPMLALEALEGLVVIDQIQLRPDLFPTLRVLADRPSRPATFLVLGSASPDLLRQSAESLAGRISYYALPGLSLEEVGGDQLDELWLRGAFPASLLARTLGESLRWRRDLVRTYLERDLVTLGIRVPPTTLRRFWTMLAHYHGQLWNGAELARAFGVGEKAVRNYLDILCSTFMVRRLPPWFSNVGKRQVKSPKVYLTDSGLVHSLLGIQDRDELMEHPKVGASWEGFALDAVLQHLGAEPEEAYFWALHSGAELDLLVVRGKTKRGFEFKFNEAPKSQRSMSAAREQLGLSQIDVVHAGPETYPLAEGIRALSLARLLDDLEPLPELA